MGTIHRPLIPRDMTDMGSRQSGQPAPEPNDATVKPPPAGSPLTVVVCTHDRPDYLRTCLQSLAAQRGSELAVIVVDSASPPDSAALIASLAAEHGATLLRAEQPGLSLARNAGLAATTSEWIAYIDDDAQPESGWAQAIAMATRALPPKAGALGGAIHPQWEAPCPAWWPPELVPALTVLEWHQAGRMGDGTLPPHVEPYGANMVFRVSALNAVGGFPPHLGRVGTRLLSGEEAWVMRSLLQAGFSVHYDPSIAVLHSIQAVRLTPDWLVGRQYWSGVSEAIVTSRLIGRLRAGRKAARLLAQLAARSPWAVLGGPGMEAVRRRCAVAFAAGYIRGTLAELRRLVPGYG
jgi:glucosyl-dolichyl phosphate glucuronosyltransferase